MPAGATCHTGRPLPLSAGLIFAVEVPVTAVDQRRQLGEEGRIVQRIDAVGQIEFEPLDRSLGQTIAQQVAPRPLRALRLFGDATPLFDDLAVR